MEILHRDEYVEIDSNDVEIGDLVVYNRNGDTTHVGIIMAVTEVGNFVLSQWGLDGEYYHRDTPVPEVYGKPSYWSERRSP